MNEQEEIQTNNNGQIISDKVWLISCVAITAIATFVRFFWLALKPLHHDEGVNGYFLKTLFEEGIYKYDPANYHGPTLYYITLAFTKIFGLETLPIRWSVAIFGVLTVVLAFYLWRYIGKIGALAAALFLALSPGMVYISRYFIHEISFVFYSLAIVVAVLYFMENRKPGIFAISSMTLLLLVSFLPTALNLSNLAGEERPVLLWSLRISLFVVEAILVYFIMRMLFMWNEGRAIYLILASASVALLFATKETGFITLGTMIIAFFCIFVWQKIYGKNNDELDTETEEPIQLSWKIFRQRLGSGTDLTLMIAAALFTFIYISILFFSSFFTYPEGILGAFEAYMIWTKTGAKDHTQNGWYAYLNWGYKLELPIFLLSAVGTMIAFIKARHRFAMFAGLWAFGLFLAYSIIPYKTPWLALSFILPMCIIAGYGINELATDRNNISKIIAGVLTIAAVAVLGYQTYDLNFVRYDDDKMPYVYAHTKREFLKLIDKIEYYAERSGKGKDATIEIVSPEYWPMPWYMNKYKNARFGGQLVDANAQEMIVASKKQRGNTNQEKDLKPANPNSSEDAEKPVNPNSPANPNSPKESLNERYGRHYKFVGEYPLRPGEDLYLLVRKDLADADTKELYEID